ncbi:MAG: carbohydrate ABC transporter permease [Truepera sp.]|jgi:multiple sugar transport system permease protein|nr:carbohydrate ABC transporter permease [Truepera sp.]
MQRRLLMAVQYLVYALIVVLMLFPLFWMVASSFKTPQELQALPPVWLPSSIDFSAYARAFSTVPFARSFLNSFVIAGGSTLGILITSIMAGYVFAKLRFRGRNELFALVLSTMFLPPIVMLVPLYKIVQSLGLVDTLAGVMLPNIANAFGIFLMRQFIAGIPDELLESARLDGASEWTNLWRIVFPLLGPAIAALVVFAFTFHWNSFLWPLTVLQSPDQQTVVLALNRLVSYTSAIKFQNVVMAGAVISVLPNVLLFVFLQRYFIAGIAHTGSKG